MLIQFTKLNIWKVLTFFFLLLFFPSLWATEQVVSNYQSDSIPDKSQFAIAGMLRTYLRSDMSKIEKIQRSYFVKGLYGGRCAGLTTLWLYSKLLSMQNHGLTNISNSDAIKNDKWFWSVVELILNWDGKYTLNYEEIASIDYFLKTLDSFQSVEKHKPGVNTGELDKIIHIIDPKHQIKREYAIGSLFTLKEFQDILKTEDFIREGRLVFITSHNHATGLFKLEDNYYYYNANSLTGEYITKSLDDLAVTIFVANGFEENTSSPIGIRIFYLDQETKPYLPPKYLLKQVTHDPISKPGYANNYSALIIATEIGSVESVQFLLGLEKTDPNAINEDYNTALIIASSYGYTDIVKTLLDDDRVKVNVTDKYGYTALILATYFGHSDVVKALLEDKHHRVNINATDNNGRTVLEYAKRYNRLDIVEMLSSYTG
ncbi:hypothetical protein GAMM_40229 [Gammaproteobacteria bacterium]